MIQMRAHTLHRLYRYYTDIRIVYAYHRIETQWLGSLHSKNLEHIQDLGVKGRHHELAGLVRSVPAPTRSEPEDIAALGE